MLWRGCWSCEGYRSVVLATCLCGIVATFSGVLMGQERAPAVQGVVVEGVSGVPLAGVVVTAQSMTELRAGTSSTGLGESRTTTDSRGAFRIDAVAEGPFVLVYSKDGYVSTSGSTTYYGDEKPVRVRAEMVRAGRISGRVVDANGTPVANAAVSAIREDPAEGGGGWSDGRLVVQTDRSGSYELTDLMPGHYFLKAEIAPEQREVVQGRTFVTTWYPAMADRQRAIPVAVEPGDLPGYTITLQTVPVQEVSGKAIDEQGRPVGRVKVQLFGRDEMTESGFAETDESGVFRLAAVPDGEWILLARAGQDLRGAERVTVAGEDRSTDVRLTTPFSEEGTVSVDGGLEFRAGMGVILQPADTPALRDFAAAGRDGRFRISGLIPWRYRIRAQYQVGAGYYVDSIRLGDQDVFGKFVDLYEGAPAIHVEYRTDGGSVSGEVEKGAGAQVVLVAKNPAFRHYVFRALCDGAGRFQITGIRPGAYAALAFDRVPEGALEDAAAMEALVYGISFDTRVEPRQATSIGVRLRKWPL